MSRWFRFYDDVLHDPKVQLLDAELFRAWVNILCVACKHDGHLPADRELGYLLMTDPVTLQATLQKLSDAGLLDVTDDGRRPHAWDKRQYKSDTSNDRVARHRAAKKAQAIGENEQSAPIGNAGRNVTGSVTDNVGVTPPDTDTDTENNIVRMSPPPRRSRVTYPADFERFWSDYPTDPNMAKKEAATAWSRLPPDDRQMAIDAIPRFKSFCAQSPTYRPVHACRFLSQRRFEGHMSAPEPGKDSRASIFNRG